MNLLLPAYCLCVVIFRNDSLLLQKELNAVIFNNNDLFFKTIYAENNKDYLY